MPISEGVHERLPVQVPGGIDKDGTHLFVGELERLLQPLETRFVDFVQLVIGHSVFSRSSQNRPQLHFRIRGQQVVLRQDPGDVGD